jgi:hypothetical protein
MYRHIFRGEGAFELHGRLPPKFVSIASCQLLFALCALTTHSHLSSSLKLDIIMLDVDDAMLGRLGTTGFKEEVVYGV